MPLVADRVKETTTTAGTGTLTLAGAATGFQSFSAAFGTGAVVYYVIAAGADWEIGIGTTGSGTLSRDTVLQSSNGDALVNWPAGTKDVFCAYVADRAVTTSDPATLTNKTIDDYTNNVGANSTHFRIKAGATLAKGDVVKAVGFTPGEQAIEVVKVASSTDVALGICEQALNTGNFGLAVVIGELFNVNTNGFTVGQTLYSNGSGGFTSTKPSSGLYQVLGWVVRANTSNGVIAVNIVAPLYVEASTNTVNTAVIRDGSGNFAAGTITAALTGNATTATTLQTARTINGVSFNGSADITVAAAAGTLTGTTLATGVTASSLTSVGTLANLTVTNPITGSVTGSSGSTTGNAATATALQTARTINGTSFNGTANITVTAATPNTLTLGTGLTGTSFNGSAAVTATVDATNINTPSKIVTRDASGNFAAGTITAALTGNASTATALSSSRTFALTGDVTGSVSSDLTSGASISTAIAAGVIVDADINASAAIADTKLATISTAGKVANSATTATNANTASAIVARDASGNFSAGTITATLSGNASTATSATSATNATNASNLTGTSNQIRTVTYTFPASQGSASTVLTNDGAGTLSWATPSAGAAAAGTLTGATLASNVVASSLTSVGTLSALTVGGTLTMQQSLEKVTIIAASLSSVVTFDALTSAVVLYTANSSNNFGVNVRGNSGTTLDSIMATGQQMTVVLMSTQGGSNFYLTTFQIDGNTRTVSWLNGIAPNSGNTSATDVYTFTILKRGANTFTVFGSMSGWR